MAKRGEGWIGGVMLALMAVVASGDEPPSPGFFTGRVVDPDGRAVPGVRVATVRSTRDRAEVEARTDAEGRFRLGPLEPVHRHRADVFVDAEGWARGDAPGDAASVYPGRDTYLGVIRLERGRVFTGRVLDADSQPRGGARVEVTVYRHIMGHTVNDIGPQPRLTTDPDGRFRTPPLAVGQLSLVVIAPERQRAHVGRPILPGGEEDLGDVKLEPDVPFTATITDEATGAPAGRGPDRRDNRVSTRSPTPPAEVHVSRVRAEPVVPAQRAARKGTPG